MAKVVKKEKKIKVVSEEVTKPVKGSKKVKAEKVPVKKAAFGGVTVNFNAVKDMTLGEVYGKTPVTMGEIPKKIWAVIHEHGLSTAKPKTPLKLLKKYWKSTKYEDLDEEVLNKHFKNCGGKKQALAKVSGIFADNEGEDFEEAIDAFYKKFVKAVKSKEE